MCDNRRNRDLTVMTGNVGDMEDPNDDADLYEDDEETNKKVKDEGIEEEKTASETDTDTKPETEVEPEPEKVELSFDDMLTSFNIVTHLLDNLTAYCAAVKAKMELNPELLQLERTKMFIITKNHSHKEEVAERLSFLQFFVTQIEFKVAKTELKVVYDLLSQSPIESDISEFFNWCKDACKNESSYGKSTAILELTDIGDFYSELID